MITVENVTKRYSNGKVDALKGISLSFSDKGFVAIIGESGSGKSTLVNILSGIDTQTSGKITYHDEKQTLDYDKRHDLTLFQRNILSYVFQETIFIDSINIEGNISLAARVQGTADSTVFKERYRELTKTKSHTRSGTVKEFPGFDRR